MPHMIPCMQQTETRGIQLPRQRSGSQHSPENHRSLARTCLVLPHRIHEPAPMVSLFSNFKQGHPLHAYRPIYTDRPMAPKTNDQPSEPITKNHNPL